MLQRGWLVFLTAAVAAGCSFSTVALPDTPKLAPPSVVALEIGGLYGVDLIRGDRAVLVDTGPEGGFDDLCAAIRAQGVEPKDLALVVLTHAHSDHAGNARAFQKLGVPILVHEGDANMLRAGDHGELFATNLEAVLAQPTIASHYPAAEPDVVVRGSEPFSLAPWGVAGEVRWVGGHTPGSLIVRTDSGAVVLGDLIRGGWFAGAVDRHAPARHLFHQYPVEDSAQIAEGYAKRVAACSDVKVAFVGHGGPIPKSELVAWAGDEKRSCPW